MLCLQQNNVLKELIDYSEDEGFFGLLPNELRETIWGFIDEDSTFAIGSRVNKRWNEELIIAWKSFCDKRGFFVELEFFQNKGKDWRWLLQCKIRRFSEEDTNKDGPGNCIESTGIYEGEFIANKKEGLGKKISLDKNIYIGQWKDDMKNGEGIYTWTNGTQYIGGWLNDHYHGYGVKSFTNGDRYEGNWKEDHKNGNGTYVWASGDVYTGEWVDNQQEGHGTFEWSSGSKYVGMFRNNLRCDNNGIFTWPNGDRYQGGFKNTRDRVGTYNYACGHTFIGNNRQGRYGEENLTVFK